MSTPPRSGAAVPAPASAGVIVTARLAAQPLDDIGRQPGRVAPAQQREPANHEAKRSDGTAAAGACVDVALDTAALVGPELTVEIRGEPARGEDVVDMELGAVHPIFDPPRNQNGSRTL
ncbi:MAG: hypothetical protein M3P50_03685 [Actinomycetota bacterium]|nr:hypothetical protein [Actinomycetota bacterium]